MPAESSAPRGATTRATSPASAAAIWNETPKTVASIRLKPYAGGTPVSSIRNAATTWPR